MKPLPTARELRGQLVAELLGSPDIYGVVLDRAARKKLRLMIHPGQLPGVEFIFAFARIYQCDVMVHFGGDTPVCYRPPGLPSGDRLTLRKKVHLQCLAGVHYNPVVTYGDFQELTVSYLWPVSPALESSCGDGGDSVGSE